MRRDCRLSGVLHVLLHMAQAEGPVTSEVLAKAMNTNPVVLRRVMAGLRDRGYVQSEKGHGGGWSLGHGFAKITLRDIYTALGEPPLLAMGNRTEAPGCAVEEAVNAALGSSFAAAESLLLSRLSEVTLETLSERIRKRPRHGHHAHHGAGTHGHPHGAVTHDLDDPARDAWQRPDDVLRALELRPTMTVADVGAGTGYFSVRLARALPRGEVIAADVAPELLHALKDRARREKLPNLRTVKATSTASGLKARSVDRILMVHVWHHLADGHQYARDLAAALRPGGKLFVVDYKLSAHRGPPAAMRVAPREIVAALEGAGLSASVSSAALPDQYIVEAQRPSRRG